MPPSKRIAPSPSRAATPPGFVDALGHSAADKRIDVLRAIGRGGSISQAARDVGLSYKAAWQAVATLTNLAGVPLVERAVGGAGGGGARLSAQGRRLLALADAFGAARQALHAPGAGHSGGDGLGAAVARLSIRTSMRNQLPAQVEALTVMGRAVQVTLALGEGAQRLTAAVTAESAELLGLAPGLPVLALCKATAVHIEAAPGGARRVARRAARAGHDNHLEGQVIERAPAADADEIALRLPGSGLQLVGFAPPGQITRRGQRARARIGAAAVVVALAV